MIASAPLSANAGFFSDMISKVVGVDTQAADVLKSSSSNNNSQTMPLVEAVSIPDTNTKAEISPQSIVIDSGEALVSNPSPLGPAIDIEQYVSNAKINIYVVKKGDTLKSIAKNFKTTENSIGYSNSDIKKSDLLKVGQKLVIIGLKSQVDKVKSDKSSDKPSDLSTKDAKDISTKVATVTQIETPTPLYLISTDIPSPADKNPSDKNQSAITTVSINQLDSQVNTLNSASASSVTTPTPDIITPTGQPSGTISSGYIWPLPEGVGRVSQGLHADQAYDFAAPSGTPIYAVQDGTVLIAHPSGYNGGYGKYVVINFDDGRQAIFGHMSKVVASEGDVVKKGDIIGYVGSTGHSTGPHVHIGFHGALGNPYVGLKLNSTDFQVND